jgi:heme/copper-type cytochrome/quinol oxidase subunit 4
MTTQKTTFGTMAAIKAETPRWAKYLFRSITVATTVIAFWIAGTALVAEPIKLEIVLILKAVDLAVLGFTKLFGVEHKAE